MKYSYADRTIFFKEKKYLLDWCEEERPFIQDKLTKKKTYINMVSISHFWWITGKKKWVLKIYRDKPIQVEINRVYKTEIVDGCLCSLSSETI